MSFLFCTVKKYRIIDVFLWVVVIWSLFYDINQLNQTIILRLILYNNNAKLVTKIICIYFP